MSQQKKRYDLCAIGEILIDFVPTGTNEAGYPLLSAYPGGAPLNFLAAALRAGITAAFIGEVGDDAFGRLLLDTALELGIDTKGIGKSNESFTTLAFVTLDESGDREFSFARKPGADTRLRLTDERIDIILNSRCLHFGTLSLTDDPALEATIEAIRLARDNDIWISFDPNYRARLWSDSTRAKESIRWGIAHADSVKLGSDELEFAYDEIIKGGETEQAAFALSQGPRIVLVTDGKEGCRVYTKDYFFSIPAMSGLATIDTTGAGDIFGGTVVGQLLREESPLACLNQSIMERIVKRATVAAGLSTERHGGISSILPWEELAKYETEFP